MSGDGDTRQVIFQHHDGWLSQLSAVPNARAAYDAADSRAPRRSHWRSSCRTRSRCVSGIWTSRVPLKPSPTRRKADQKKSPSHMSLTARDTPPRCSNSDLQHVRELSNLIGRQYALFPPADEVLLDDADHIGGPPTFRSG